MALRVGDGLGTLIVFLLLWAALFGTGLVLGRRLADLRRFGADRTEPDLERARAIWGSAAAIVALMVAELALIVAAGEWWADQWRASWLGRIALEAMGVVAGVSLVGAFISGVYQQWSRRGSYGGMARSALWFFVLLFVLVLISRWRLG